MVTFTIFILTLFTIIILYYITFTFIYTERCSVFFIYGYHLSLVATNLELNQTKVIWEQPKEMLSNASITIKNLFNNSAYRNNTILSKYVWDIEEKHNESSVFKWLVVRTVLSYSNITIRRWLCLDEKLSYYITLTQVIYITSNLI